jgi:hypothetical protein
MPFTHQTALITGGDRGEAGGAAAVFGSDLVQGDVLLGEALRFLLADATTQKSMHPCVTSIGPIIQVGKNREILTVLLNVLQGLAADVVRAGLLREECLGIKAQVITDGQNPRVPRRIPVAPHFPAAAGPGPGRRPGGSGGGRSNVNSLNACYLLFPLGGYGNIG